MIKYSLRCREGHEFEAWFRDSAAYDAQAAAGQLSCAVCGGHDVEKAIMAPRLRKSRSEAPPEAERSEPQPKDQAAVMPAPPGGPREAELRRVLQVLRRHVEESCDYVGPEFAEEARRIHKGEADARGIYGEASDQEARDLDDEGIEVARIPWLSRDDA